MPETYKITAEEWEFIRPYLSGEPGTRGRTAKDNRRFVDAVVLKRLSPLLTYEQVGRATDIPGTHIWQRENRWARNPDYEPAMEQLIDRVMGRIRRRK